MNAFVPTSRRSCTSTPADVPAPASVPWVHAGSARLPTPGRAAAIAGLRQRVLASGVPLLTLDEINERVGEMRRRF